MFSLSRHTRELTPRQNIREDMLAAFLWENNKKSAKKSNNERKERRKEEMTERIEAD